MYAHVIYLYANVKYIYIYSQRIPDNRKRFKFFLMLENLECYIPKDSLLYLLSYLASSTILYNWLVDSPLISDLIAYQVWYI